MLRIYPPEFRRHYSDEMERATAARARAIADGRGIPGLIRFTAELVLDWAGTSLQEWGSAMGSLVAARVFLAATCAFTLLSGAWLAIMESLLRHPAFLQRTFVALLLAGQSLLTLVLIRRKPSALGRVALILGGGFVGILGGRAVASNLTGPHFEGFALVIGAVLVTQAALTIWAVLGSFGAPGRRKTSATLLTLAALAVCGQRVAAQTTVSPEALSAISDRVLSAQLHEGGFRAAAVALVVGDEIVLTRGYGSLPPDGAVPDPATTLFRAASVSKLFVATAVLQLAEQGKVRLDQDVNSYLKRFQLQPPQSPPVTLASLLTHTSGIENWFLGSLVRSPSDLVPLGEYFVRRPPRTFGVPGGKVTYSNQGMALAAHVVEAVSGEDFADYAERHILQPLGMTRSTFRQKDGIAFLAYPAGSLRAPAAEMAKFIRMQLNSGLVDGNQVLQPETVSAMQQRHWSAHPHAPGVAYGFFEGEVNGERVLFHTGDSGDHSLLLLVPSQGWGCYVVYSTDDPNGQKVRDAFANAMVPGRKDIADGVAHGPDNANDEDVAGAYQAASVNPYTVEKVLGLTQQLRIVAGAAGVITLQPMKESGTWTERDLFRTADGAYLAFRRDATGAVVGGTRSGFIWDPLSFDRIPWFEEAGLHLGILAASVAGIASRLVVGFFTLARGWFRRTPSREGPPSMAEFGWKLSGISALLPLIGIVCAIGNLVVWRPPITGVPPGFVALLGCLLLFSLLAVVLPFFAFIAWRQKAFGVIRRLYFSGFAVVGVLFALWLNHWNLLGFRF